MTNSCSNTLFSRLSSFIIRTLTPTSQHSKEKQVYLMKEGRCFSCKEKGHIAYECPKKEKIVAISEGVSKDSNR